MSDKSSIRSEDELGYKLSRCGVDTGVKMLGGLAVGTAFSLFLLKRRFWPITLGVGTGFGMGYANCEQDVNRHTFIDVSKLGK